MSKSNKELAVDLAIAQIHASSVIKLNQMQTGNVFKSRYCMELSRRLLQQIKSVRR